VSALKPLAYARRWYADGEVPAKVRNENGRMAWPRKFILRPVTESKIQRDDVALVSADDVAELIAAARAVADRLAADGAPTRPEREEMIARLNAAIAGAGVTP